MLKLAGSKGVFEVIEFLPHVNVLLNSLATIFLVAGFVFIKQRRIDAHKTMMLATFGVNVIFLISYLTYHANAGSKPFPVDTAVAPTAIRYFYYVLLASHVLLAAVVPFLAVWTIYLGLTDRRQKHRKVAVWTWPIWLYVSVTGIMVYLMLYQIYVPTSTT